MYDTGKDVRRGYHAHKNLEQILICIHGSCKILLDNGNEKKVVPLEKPYEGLYVSNEMWREMFDIFTRCSINGFSFQICMMRMIILEIMMSF